MIKRWTSDRDGNMEPDDRSMKHEAVRNDSYVLATDYGALRAAYGEAIQDIEDWAAYASEYFQEKYDLPGLLKLHADRLADFAFDAEGKQ